MASTTAYVGYQWYNSETSTSAAIHNDDALSTYAMTTVFKAILNPES